MTGRGCDGCARSRGLAVCRCRRRSRRVCGSSFLKEAQQAGLLSSRLAHLASYSAAVSFNLLIVSLAYVAVVAGYSEAKRRVDVFLLFIYCPLRETNWEKLADQVDACTLDTAEAYLYMHMKRLCMPSAHLVKCYRFHSLGSQPVYEG